MESEIIKRLQQWRSGKKPGPYSIELSPTLRCNLNCKFCWRHEQKEIEFGKELTKEDYFKLLEEAKELGVKEVKIIGGGEPSFRRDTIKIMQKIKELGFFGYICTNGTMFTKKDIELLVKIKWNHLKISFHGPDKETHDFLTHVPGSFEKVIKNINIINQFKAEFNSDFPYIEFGFVLGNKNYKKVPGMIKLANELKVNAVFVEPITVYSDTGKKMKLNSKEEKEFETIAKDSFKLSKSFKISTNLSNFFNQGLIQKTNSMQNILLSNKKENDSFLSIPCYEPFYRVGIRSDGIVCPCGFLDEGSTQNIKEKALKEIWLGDYFEKRRKEMLENKLSPYCARCCTTLVSNNLEIKKQLKGEKN